MSPGKEPKPAANLRPVYARSSSNYKPTREADRYIWPVIKEMLAARHRAGLTQEAIAVRLNTTRSAISRLESGKFHRPTLTTLEHYALVTGCRLEIRFRTVFPRAALDDSPQ